MPKNMYQADEKSSSRLKELSGNWQKIQLGNISEVQSGGTPLCSIKEYWDGNIAWYSSGELNNAETSSPERKITQIGLKNSNAKLFPKGSLLIGIYDTAALKMSILDRDAAFNQAVVGIKPKEGVNLNFILYYISAKKDEILSLRRGVRQKNLSLAKIKDIEVLLPPLPEQTRIVAILDEAFANISQAVANAEKNLANARELFDSYLNEVFSQSASQSPSQTLTELTELIVDCEHKTAPTQNSGYPSIRTPNIGKGELLLDGVYRVSEETYKVWTKRAIPKAGDLILAREAPAGNVGVVPQGENVCLGQRTVLIRPKLNIINSEYLAFLMLHPIMQKRLLAGSTGATVQHVNVKDIRALGFGTLPSKTFQNEVVHKIKAAKSYSENLEDIYRRKLAALAELKQALLQKAFTGELTVANHLHPQ